MQLRRHYADPHESRRAELAEIAAWLAVYPATQCRFAYSTRASLFWPRFPETARQLTVTAQIQQREVEIERIKVRRYWWRASANSAETPAV
jgi:hypothetical protein